MFAPVQEVHALGFLPSGVTVEEEEVGAIAMSAGGDAAFGAEGSAGAAIGQMVGGPDVVKAVAAEDVGGGEDRAPGGAFVVGEVDGGGGSLDAGEGLEAGNFAAGVIQGAGEGPGVDDVAHNLAFVRVSAAGVDFDAAVFVFGGAGAAEVGDENLPPEGFIAAGHAPVVFVGVKDHGNAHLAEVVVAVGLGGFGFGAAECGEKHSGQNGNDGDDDEEFYEGEAWRAGAVRFRRVGHVGFEGRIAAGRGWWEEEID